MMKLKFKLTILSIIMLAVFLVPSCERTIEEEIVKPIEAIHGQKKSASLEVAVSNVRIVRAALMRYPVTSGENLFPRDMELYNYDSMRKILPDESLPPDMTELMWDSAYGIVYISDGYTFTFEVRATTEEGPTITATQSGVTENQ